MVAFLAEVRTQLWHFRKGGVVALREHRRRLKAGGRQLRPGHLWETRAAGGRRSIAYSLQLWANTSTGVEGPRCSVKVGTILDTFSELAFAPEWDQVPLKHATWRQQIEDSKLDLLFVESAWHGSGDSWRHRVSRPEVLGDLVAHCRSVGIPTVFWNKEDPVHFSDFIATAALFDYVYTTDVNMVAEYVSRLGHSRVSVLPFAAQQSIHNPVRPRGWSEESLRDSAFAGTYFRHKYPERRQQMDDLIGGAIRAAKKTRGTFDIFSRFMKTDPNYEFPKQWQQYVRGELTYEQMLTAYRSYRTFLNVNSVVGSPSMCARRIFEITACGTPVVSAPSEAIDAFFPDGGVLQAGSEQVAYDTVRALTRSPELRDRLTAVGQRQIWLKNTYTHRVDQILEDVGLGDRKYVRPTVSALISTNRPQQLEHVLAGMREQKEVELEILVLTHGFEPSVDEKAHLESRFGPVQWLTAEPSVPLGECYNILARAASGDVVAKIDDDDIYGPYYLFGQLAAMDYSGADIVGKGAHYVYLEGMDATVLRFPETEHKYRDFVSGPTIVAKRSVVLVNPFPQVWRGEDTGFLRSARDNGAVTFSAGRFDFIQVRSSGTHTWSIEDSEILATAKVSSYGLAKDHVIF